MWSGEWLTERQATSRPDHFWPELWRGMARNAKLREKHKWAIENPKLDNARRLRGIYFIDPDGKEFKENIWNARRKLETPMAPAMPCKTCKKSKNEETRSKTNDCKSKFACILEASESTRMRLEESLPKCLRTILQEDGTIHYNITIWYTNLFLCLKQWRYPQQKQQWIKNGRNNAPKIQRSSCTPTLRKMILDLMQYSQSNTHQHLKWRQQRSWISYPDCQDAQDKQLMQYLLIKLRS